MRERIKKILVCPRDKKNLLENDSWLICSEGHRYPVLAGIPVLLVDNAEQTASWAKESIKRSFRNESNEVFDGHFHLTKEIMQNPYAREAIENQHLIDPIASLGICGTNGIAYQHLVGKLKEYPIPTLRLPAASGQTFLDVGCGWGRWCIAAARKGYRPIGLDPNLDTVMGAKRIAEQLGLEIDYIVADGRFLPFAAETMDQVFSYSVLQHISEENVMLTLKEVSRVMKASASSLIQMPNQFGVRSLCHQFRRRFRKPKDFEVRYWNLPTLKRLFNDEIGDSSISVDCFFGLGLQFSDLKFMTPPLKIVVLLSEILRQISRLFTPLKYLADSVYVQSVKVPSTRRKAEVVVEATD